MRLLVKIVFFLFTILLLVSCMIACFTYTPIDEIPNRLSLSYLLENFETLNENNFLVSRISDITSSLENPIPDVAVIGDILDVFIGAIKVLLFACNSVLVLIDFITSIFTFLFSFI